MLIISVREHENNRWKRKEKKKKGKTKKEWNKWITQAIVKMW